VHRIGHALDHTARDGDPELLPTYRLPEHLRLGNVVVLDDLGTAKSIYETKKSGASRQALASKKYSPFWEGVVNLRQPDNNENISDYKKDITQKIISWIDEYNKLTGHKVLRSDIHLDEGHISDGDVVYNVHAHVIIDRTDNNNRIININARQMRQIQDMTARTTGLERGIAKKITGIEHISHHQYRHLAEQGRLLHKDKIVELARDVSDERSAVDLLASANDELQARLQAQQRVIDALERERDIYKTERDQLKASGVATQMQYQQAKAHHLALMRELDVELAEARQALADSIKPTPPLTQPAKTSPEPAKPLQQRMRP